MAKILIVDDEKIALTMLESLLKKFGHEVSTAGDAMAALEKVKAAAFDLVITDVKMPGSSGLDLARHLRNDKELKGLKILLLTGLREKKDVERGIQVGVDGYLIKPIDPKALKEKVNSVLNPEPAAPAAVEVAWREEAKYVESLQIVGVSSEGMSFHSSQPFHPGSTVQIEAKIFDRAAVKTPYMKVLKSMPVADSGKHLVRTEFVDVDGDFKSALVNYIEEQAKKAS